MIWYLHILCNDHLYKSSNSSFPYKSEVKFSQLCLTLYSPWDSPGQNPGVGSLSLLQGIFTTHGLTQVSCIAGGFFTSWTTRETYTKLLLYYKHYYKPYSLYCILHYHDFFIIYLEACNSQFPSPILPTPNFLSLKGNLFAFCIHESVAVLFL